LVISQKKIALFDGWLIESQYYYRAKYNNMERIVQLINDPSTGPLCGVEGQAG
jgi:hypothetical protein